MLLNIILCIYIEIYCHLCYFLVKINEFVEESDLLSEN